MQPSLAGALVCVALLLLGMALRSPLIVPLMASLAFGSTAIATLTALGGSSPLIYTVFAVFLILSLLLRRGTRQDLARVFKEYRSAWLVSFLVVYAACGAVILPRLFAGQTSAFVASRDEGRVAEVLLMPVSGNVTQTAYFALGALAFVAISVRLLQRPALDAVRKGFLALAAANALLGAIDLLGKLAGAGDVLLPIRSASYALVTDVEHAGFFRIAGGHSEASAFGSATLVSLAFTLTYWRLTGSRGALVLWIVLAVLLILCTSSTAYAGLAVMTIPLGLSVLRSSFAGRFSLNDLLLGFLVGVGFAVALAVAIHDERAFDPFVRLFQQTIIEKPHSVSAQERGYWNERSLQTVVDTSGWGIGLGSSRASNWMIAVLSQLGVIGAILFLILVATLLRGPGAATRASPDRDVLVLHDSVRAATFASLVCAALAGTNADPGVFFFVSLATVLACRRHLRRRAPAPSRAPARLRLAPLGPAAA